MITNFESFASYRSFVFARGFWDRTENRPFSYAKSRIEKLGDVLTRPFLGSLDYAGKNIKNPIFVTAMVIIGIALTSIVFYPNQFFQLVDKINVLRITGSTTKFALYLAVQTTIVGLFLRTWGRLQPNGPLMQAWTTNRLFPIAIGTTVVQR